MSIPVDLDRLAETLEQYDGAYLLTVSAEQRVRAVRVEATLRQGVFDVGSPGRRTAANLAERPDVTLLFPPREPDGYTLIVDGTAAVSAQRASVRPAAAVLHRPGTPPAAEASVAGTSGCQADCVPLGGRER